MPMMPEALQIHHYDRRGNTPGTWLSSADSLQAAARFLKSHRDQLDSMPLKAGDSVPDEGKITFPGYFHHCQNLDN
jgi:hypothetical protein